MLPQLFIPLWGYISAVCLFQGVSHGLNMLVPVGHIIVPSSIMPYTTGSCHWITLVPLLFPLHSNLSLAYLPLVKIDGKKKKQGAFKLHADTLHQLGGRVCYDNSLQSRTLLLDCMVRPYVQNQYRKLCVKTKQKKSAISKFLTQQTRENCANCTKHDIQDKTRKTQSQSKVCRPRTGFVLLMISGRVFEMANEPITSCHIAASPKWLTLSDFLGGQGTWGSTPTGGRGAAYAAGVGGRGAGRTC